MNREKEYHLRIIETMARAALLRTGRGHFRCGGTRFTTVGNDMVAAFEAVLKSYPHLFNRSNDEVTK